MQKCLIIFKDGKEEREKEIPGITHNLKLLDLHSIGTIILTHSINIYLIN